MACVVAIAADAALLLRCRPRGVLLLLLAAASAT
jgi:hypothetical protein